MQDPAYLMGMAAVAVSAVTGVLEAGRKSIDLFGVVLVALISALGGGTLRDLLVNRTVFWIADQTYLLAAVGAGIATFVLVRVVRLPARLFLVPDALGLALFTVLGTQIGLMAEVPWFAATLLGVMTAVFGGVLRDILCNEEPLVFTGELYATASWGGAILYVLLVDAGFAAGSAAGLAMAAIFVVRLAAIRFKLSLPRFESRR
jgi:uncharacterized membrane protein YeiH